MLDTQEQRRGTLTAAQAELSTYERNYTRLVAEDALLKRLGRLSAPSEGDPSLLDAEAYISEEREVLAARVAENDWLVAGEEGTLRELREAVEGRSG